MRERPQNGKSTSGRRRPPAWRQAAKAALLVAVVQTFLTISGRGIEGFVAWMIILFIGYWLLFTILIWLWRVLKRRA